MDKMVERKGLGRPKGSSEDKQKQYVEMLNKGRIKQPKEEPLNIISCLRTKRVNLKQYDKYLNHFNNMNLLELFSGSGLVGIVARSLGFNVIFLDMKNADINCDILEWDYKPFDRNHFDFIWSSPPCTECSIAKTTGIRNIEYANSLVLKTLEIVEYFGWPYFVIEIHRQDY